MRKVLLLERNHGHRDQAVIGGLESFVARWLPGPAATALVAYDRLTVEERASRLQQALQALDGRAPAPAAPSPAPPAVRADSPALDPSPVRRPSRAADRSSAVEPASARRVGTGLETPVRRLTGVGPANAKRLERLGVVTVRDLLYHVPSRHLDYSQLKKVRELQPGELTTVVASIWDVSTFQTRRGFERIEAIAGDETGNLLAVWFRRRDYFGSKLRGRQVVLSGRVESRNGRLYLNDPEYEFLEQADLVNTARLVPVYPLTEGLNQRWLRNLERAVVERYAPMVEDHLPDDLLQERFLLDLPTALSQAHFPDDETELGRARRRLAFDELFLIQLGVAQRRRAWQEVDTAPKIEVSPELDSAFVKALPFHLTGAQRRVSDDILSDLRQRRPMGRLLQGDVGSGKTVVAARAILAAAGSGHQSLLMAPTEILAEQHHRNVATLLEAAELRQAFAGARGRGGPEIALLVGSTPRAQRRVILAAAAAGELDVLIGTHTLIQETVELPALGLAVIDEQHRFGVLQRSALRHKGQNPHLLVMTATPIPRTLALTIYGELDVSVIDELPPGRQVVKTRWVGPERRSSAYEFVRRQVQEGRQAFVVCPLVEESENVAARAATVEFERLRTEVFPELRLGLLHGRMSAAEKDAAMAALRGGETQILVATAVIEVGIDVPNATVMLVEGADRFGLAQLHQLRGRVGRGADQSYCILLSESPSVEGEERLRVIEDTTDGFALAEADLRIRGPGEFLGTRQSGLPDLKVANLGDIALLEEARQTAFQLIQLDPELRRPEHLRLGERAAALAALATEPV